MANDLAKTANDFSMNQGNQTAKPFLMCTIGLLMLGIVVRSTSLLQSHAIATDSNKVGLQMENLRNKLQSSLRPTEQPDTDMDDARWLQIQDDLKLGYQDQPDLLGRTRFIEQHFDPSARVRLLPGLDGQPGTAEFDDNVNGVIDDAGELGATFSDDLCVVEASQESASQIEPSIVLQRGAYTAADQNLSQPTTRHPDRILVLYQGQDDAWSFVLDR